MTDQTPDQPPLPPRSAFVVRVLALLIVAGIAGLEFFRPQPPSTVVLAILATVLALVFGPVAVRDFWPGNRP